MRMGGDKGARGTRHVNGRCISADSSLGRRNSFGLYYSSNSSNGDKDKAIKIKAVNQVWLCVYYCCTNRFHLAIVGPFLLLYMYIYGSMVV